MSLVHAGYAIGGVDISEWQYPVNFNILLPKINFIIIRAGAASTSVSGSYIYEDKRFDDYWRDTRGFAKAAYWYFHPKADPTQQAEKFVEIMKRVGMYTANMGLFVDVEEKLEGQTRTDYTNRLLTFMKIVDSKIDSPYNKYVGIYTRNDIWTGCLEYIKIPNINYRTAWMAQYPRAYPMDKPTLNLPGFPKLHIWQFSRTGGKPDNVTPGEGKKWGVYSYGLDTDVWLLSPQEFETWFRCKPSKVDLMANLPLAIKPFQSGYYLRKSPTENSLVMATTMTNPIEIQGATEDERGRLWYQVGKSLWIAAWIGEPIYK